MRRSHHGERSWDGVVSYYAYFCWEYGENPDVNELERYNALAKAKDCQHERLRRIERDDGSAYYVCGDCDLSKDRNWTDKFIRCNNYHSSYDPPCGKCGGLYYIRKAAATLPTKETP